MLTVTARLIFFVSVYSVQTYLYVMFKLLCIVLQLLLVAGLSQTLVNCWSQKWHTKGLETTLVTATAINMLIPFTMSNFFITKHSTAEQVASSVAMQQQVIHSFACSPTVNVTLCKRTGFYTSTGTGPCLDLALKVSISSISNFTITVNQPTLKGLLLQKCLARLRWFHSWKIQGFGELQLTRQTHYKKLEKWKLWTLLTSTNA